MEYIRIKNIEEYTASINTYNINLTTNKLFVNKLELFDYIANKMELEPTNITIVEDGWEIYTYTDGDGLLYYIYELTAHQHWNHYEHNSTRTFLTIDIARMSIGVGVLKRKLEDNNNIDVVNLN